MIIVVMLGWWYSQGFAWALGRIPAQLKNIGRIFAVRVLIQTWFSPWKQITSTSSFRNFFQAAIDNMISRTIGGIVRTMMLLTALIWAIFATVSGILFVILWPLLPVSIVILPVLTIMGVTL